VRERTNHVLRQRRQHSSIEQLRWSLLNHAFVLKPYLRLTRFRQEYNQRWSK